MGSSFAHEAPLPAGRSPDGAAAVDADGGGVGEGGHQGGLVGHVPQQGIAGQVPQVGLLASHIPPLPVQQYRGVAHGGGVQLVYRACQRLDPAGNLGVLCSAQTRIGWAAVMRGQVRPGLPSSPWLTRSRGSYRLLSGS